MRYLFFIAALISNCSSFAQVDTNYLKALYDRCLDFSETKADSVAYYADFIDQAARKIHFSKAAVLSLRLRGIAADLETDYRKAINYYLQSLEAARKLGQEPYIEAAYSDLAIAYSAIKQPARAKEMYRQILLLEHGHRNIESTLSTYINLGAIYNLLNQPDSALVFLNEGLRISEPHRQNLDLSNLYNNLGNVYFKKQEFDKALGYFRRNYAKHQVSGDRNKIWYDVLNMADVFISREQYDSALHYLNSAMQIATDMHSVSKKSDVYSLYAKYYSHTGNYKKAFEYQQDWYKIDTALVNEETNRQVAKLQELYNVKEKETQNRLLQSEVGKERLRVKGVTLLAIALGLIGIFAAMAFMTKRNANRRLKNTNELITRQNQKLAELNHEKNSLISIVSHDLSTPFATIQMWAQLFDADSSRFADDERKAIGKILYASEYGEKLIRRILDVEKADIGRHAINLENFDLKIFVEDLVDGFRPAAEKKSIQVHVEAPRHAIYLLSDRQLVTRICENLLSNAIKYTPRGKQVWIGISDEKEAISIKVRDEGVGIAPEELPYLFSKYSKVSSRPTDGEASTGLGLSIVKRIVEELNGSIFCESEPDKGSLFTVVLGK